MIMRKIGAALLVLHAGFRSLAAAEPTPEIEWMVVGEGPHPGFSDPLFTNGLVIVGSDAGDVRALDAKNGESRWRYSYGARIYARPECDARHIYAISESRGLISLDRDHGTIVWERPSQQGFGALAVSVTADLVFVGGNDGFIRALDSATGHERWATNVLNDARPDPAGFDGTKARFSGKPARPTAATCDRESVFVSLFDQSRVVGLDIVDGAKKFDYQAGGWILHAPFVGEDCVFIGSQDRALHRVDRASSKFAWSFMTSARIESSAAADERKVYFGSCDGGFYCIDRESGEELWKFDVETDGKRTKAIYSDPLLIEDMVCFAAGEGHVYGLDRESGRLRWKFLPVEGSESMSSPASDGKRIFVTTRPSRDNTGKAAVVAIDLYPGQ
jgi:outer membrane protein assembly factor BamB